MRYLVTASIAILLFISVFSQQTKIDSLRYQLSLSGKDKGGVDIMIEISNWFWDNFKIDSSFAYGNRAADLSRKINYPLGEARGIHMTTAYVFFTQHHYVKCLSNCIYALTVFEKEKDSVYILRSLGALAAIYALSEEFGLAIYYDKKMIELAEIMNNRDKLLEGIYGMAEGYSMLGKRDSSVLYYQEGFRLTNLFAPADSNFAKGRSYLGLARASYLSQDYDIALSYLKKAHSYAQNLKSDGSGIKVSIQLTYVDIFTDLKQWDSALNRIRVAAVVGENVDAGMYKYYDNIQVANVFEHINKDSAIKYYKMAHNVKTAFSSRTRDELNNVAQLELNRQQHIREEEQMKEKTRARNIQYTAIAIALGTFVVLFLLYSRSIIGKEKLIRYLGVMLLLIVFEFLNLYLHPFLVQLTGDSPLLMLFAMVSIAALLIPGHHRIEHWISHQLVEKNKRIRLEAAKKTISKLERKEN